MTRDDIKNHIVCINGGSGVIFQPSDEYHTYILTAKHVFNDISKYNNLAKIYYFDSTKQAFTKLNEIQPIEGENYFKHINKEVDIAILKIDKLLTMEELLINDNYCVDCLNYMLVGFPEVRRKLKPEICLDWIRYDVGIEILQKKENERREADISKNQNKQELIGSSGGGIFKIIGDSLFLTGIQNQMACDDDEQLGRIEFTPIEVFNEIVANNSGELETINPPYLRSFSHLESLIFDLDLGIYKGIHSAEPIINKLIMLIKSQAKNVLASDVTPISIQQFNKNMLLPHQNYLEQQKKIYWVRWFELLTILHIARQKIYNTIDLPALFSEVWLLYSDSNKDFLQSHLHDLLKIDFSKLEEDGFVIVSSNVKADEKYTDLSGIPSNILEEYKREYELNDIYINNASEHPFDKFKFINISAFKEAIVVDHYLEFDISNNSECLRKLGESYECLKDK